MLWRAFSVRLQSDMESANTLVGVTAIFENVQAHSSKLDYFTRGRLIWYDFDVGERCITSGGFAGLRHLCGKFYQAL